MKQLWRLAYHLNPLLDNRKSEKTNFPHQFCCHPILECPWHALGGDHRLFGLLLLFLNNILHFWKWCIQLCGDRPNEYYWQGRDLSLSLQNVLRSFHFLTSGLWVHIIHLLLSLLRFRLIFNRFWSQLHLIFIAFLQLIFNLIFYENILWKQCLQNCLKVLKVRSLCILFLVHNGQHYSNRL